MARVEGTNVEGRAEEKLHWSCTAHAPSGAWQQTPPGVMVLQGNLKWVVEAHGHLELNHL